MRRALAGAALAALCALAAAAPAAPAAVRHAAPGATGPEPCAPSAPCSFADAVAGAAPADEILLAPGDHEVGAPVHVSAPTLVIRGPATGPRPRIVGTGTTVLSLWAAGVRLSDLRVEARDAASAPVISDQSGGVMYERLEIVAAGATGSGLLLRDGSTLLDSVVWAPGPDATAVVTSGFNTGAPLTGTRLENVTAIGGSGFGSGVAASSCYGEEQQVTLVNVIARGGFADVRSSEQCNLGDGSPPAVDVHLQTSNAVMLQESAGGEIHDGGGNQTAAPLFASAASGDFRQSAGSPTIDAGTDTGRAGARDLEGHPRRLGARPDIGADERPFPPLAVTGAATAVGATAATLAGTVDARGLPATYRFEYGPTTAYGSWTPALTGAGGALAAHVTGLLPGTTYHFRLVAANAAGPVAAGDASFTTAPVAAGATPATGVDVAPPVLGRLAMTRRRFAVGRGIAFRLDLSEPARVTIGMQRALPGRRAGGRRCSTGARRGRRCTVYRHAGRLVRMLGAGPARVAFSGRIGRRALRPGRYRATVRATDAAGNASRPRRIAFTVARR